MCDLNLVLTWSQLLPDRKQVRNVSEVGDNMGVARGKGSEESVSGGLDMLSRADGGHDERDGVGCREAVGWNAI